jgi:hypothetical protein
MLVVHAPGGFYEMLRVEDGNGRLLAEGVRSMEGLIGLMEMVISDTSGRFLMAFRLAHAPGQKIVEGPIPYIAVDDRGRTVGDLRWRMTGLTGRSYELWSQGEALLTVPSASRSQPYPLLLRGVPVAMITEEVPLSARTGRAKWTYQFSAPAPRLAMLALAVYIAARRGHTGIPT